MQFVLMRRPRKAGGAAFIYWTKRIACDKISVDEKETLFPMSASSHINEPVIVKETPAPPPP